MLQRVLRALFFTVLAAVAAADVLVARHEPHFWGDRLPLFWSAFGLGCCIAMALACKGLSKKMLARDEDYYEQ